MANFRLDIVKKNFERVKAELPDIIAQRAVTYFTFTFREQGIGSEKWQEVQRRIVGTKAYRYPKSKGLSRRKKPILIGTGRLKRAVANSKKMATFDKIVLEVNLPYAAAQNYGNVNIPARPFMKETKQLKQKIRSTIHQYIDSIWQA